MGALRGGAPGPAVHNSVVSAMTDRANKLASKTGTEGGMKGLMSEESLAEHDSQMQLLGAWKDHLAGAPFTMGFH